MPFDCTVVIPNYNGSQIIGNVLSALPTGIPAVVIDDASTDGSVDSISTAYPEIEIIGRSENGGFSVAVNEGIRRASSEFVLLLNNDVSITPSFLDSVGPLFADPSVFSVGPRILLTRRGNWDEGCAVPKWHHGLLYGAQPQNVSEVRPILYTTGCAAVYRRSMLEDMGGFDEAYSPFYWEDVDLCYRAWKRGWKSLYQPAGTVYHQHSASISKIRASYTGRIKARNSLFFIWRNIEDKGIVAAHRRWLPLVLAKRTAAGDTAFLGGWRDACSRRQEAVAARNLDSRHRILSDREIFAQTGIEV